MSIVKYIMVSHILLYGVLSLLFLVVSGRLISTVWNRKDGREVEMEKVELELDNEVF